MADRKTLWDYVSEEELESRLGSYRRPSDRARVKTRQSIGGRKGMLTPEEIKLLMVNPEFLELLAPSIPDTVKTGPGIKSRVPAKSSSASFTPTTKNFPIIGDIPQTGAGSAYINREHIDRLISNIVENRGQQAKLVPESNIPGLLTPAQDDGEKIDAVLENIGSGKKGPAEEGIARGIDWGALIDIAIGLPGAERSQGFSSNVPSAIAQSAQQVYGARAAAAQEEQKNMLELYKEQLKNQPTAPTVNAETTRLYTQLGNYKHGLGLIKRLKGIMSEGIGPTGGPGKGLNLIRNIGSALGINLGETASGKLDLAVAELRKQLIASRVFGREANRAEQKLIKALIPESGFFKNLDQLDAAYSALKVEMQRQANEVASLMTNLYGLKPYHQVVPPPPIPSGANIYTRPNPTAPKKIGNK